MQKEEFWILEDHINNMDWIYNQMGMWHIKNGHQRQNLLQFLEILMVGIEKNLDAKKMNSEHLQ